ncbi:MAG: VRR-NUC domain-containing protein [Saprospiraceae bacterium]|nr:VRR-NUC domain-containing protein [Saprospiraceae bacterium]
MSEPKSELQLQSQAWTHAWNTYPLLRKRIFQVYNNTDNLVQAMQKKAAGLVAGVPDMCCLLPDQKIVWIEFKFGINKLSSKQVEIHDNWKALGHQIFTVRTMTEFQTVLDYAILPNYK